MFLNYKKIILLLLSYQSLALSADLGVFVKNAPPKSLLKDLTQKNAPETSELVQLEGQVEKICERKGCWMFLKDGEQSVRVTFKGYSFFVSKELQGQKVLVEGILKKRTVSVKEQKHLLEDAGASSAEQDAVKEEKLTWEFVASGVRALPKS